jgi:hypothetical protein
MSNLLEFIIILFHLQDLGKLRDYKINQIKNYCIKKSKEKKLIYLFMKLNKLIK